MSYEPRVPIWGWRQFLTVEERKAVAALDREIKDAKTKSATASARLNPIRNRAIHRAKYAALQRGAM